MTNRPSYRQACIATGWKRVVDESRPVGVAVVGRGRGRGNGRAQAVLDGLQAAGPGTEGVETEVGNEKTAGEEVDEETTRSKKTGPRITRSRPESKPVVKQMKRRGGRIRG